MVLGVEPGSQVENIWNVSFHSIRQRSPVAAARSGVIGDG